MARKGDWGLGLRGITLYRRAVRAANANPEDVFKLLFAMRIDRTLTFAQYFRAAAFKHKRPIFGARDVVHRVGDNIYEPLIPEPISENDYKQLPSQHSRCDGSPDDAQKNHDLGGGTVLVSAPREFWYFGRRPEALPKELQKPLFKGSPRGFRGFRTARDPKVLGDVIEFLSGLPRGVTVAPHTWPDDDDSWKQ